MSLAFYFFILIVSLSKPKVGRRNELKIRVEIENRKTIEKIIEIKSWFSQKDKQNWQTCSWTFSFALVTSSPVTCHQTGEIKCVPWWQYYSLHIDRQLLCPSAVLWLCRGPIKPSKPTTSTWAGPRGRNKTELFEGMRFPFLVTLFFFIHRKWDASLKRTL